MHCVAVRQVAFEDLGVWEAEIAAHGYTVEYLDAGVDPLDDAMSADLLVVLGGPISVYDAALYPVIDDQVGLVRARMADARPTVGVCLGAQIMAAALGAAVYPGTLELGWSPVELTDAGRTSALAAVGSHPVLHWHGDTFDLPSGAVLLARTQATPHQAFQAGAALGIQFHPEVDPQAIESWLIGHATELRLHGIDIEDIRAQAQRDGDASAMAGVQVIRSYLRSLES